MKILLIGGTGFIGRFLAPQLLDAGHDVLIAHRPGSTEVLPAGARSIEVDRRALSAASSDLRALAPDVVIDLILSSGRQATELVDVFRGHAERVVAISSMDVYRATGILHGSEPGPLQSVPLTEDSELRTRLQTYPPAQIAMLQNVFGWLDEEYDKIPVERAVASAPDLPATVLRLPMIYGPGDRLHRFHGLLQRMHDRRPAVVLQESWAHWRSPRGYVENVAAAIALAATDARAAGRVYNVAEAESHTELEWAHRIARAVGWEGAFVVVPADALPASLRVPGNLAQHWVVSSERLRRELDYRERVAADEALGRTIAWETANPPAAPVGPPLDYAAEDAVIAAHRSDT